MSFLQRLYKLKLRFTWTQANLKTHIDIFDFLKDGIMELCGVILGSLIITIVYYWQHVAGYTDSCMAATIRNSCPSKHLELKSFRCWLWSKCPPPPFWIWCCHSRMHQVAHDKPLKSPAWCCTGPSHATSTALTCTEDFCWCPMVYVAAGQWQWILCGGK